MVAVAEVSVVIPAYRAARFVGAAVANARRQGIADVEIIVVDDGSDDGTAEAAEQAGARVIRQANAGPSAARNAGLRAAQGEWIAFQDADDLWPVGTLARLKRKLETSGKEVVVGRTQNVKLGGGEVPDLRYDSPAATLAQICLPAALFRRRVFERVGVFNEEIRLAEDHEWFLRAREAGAQMEIEAEVTLVYRHHGANTTHRMEAAQFGLNRVLLESLRRRRAQGLGPLAPWLSMERRAPQVRGEFRISVVIPAYEAERYLGAALKSVAEQRLPVLEVLVVDDGSTDGTVRVAERFGGRVRVLKQARGGAAAARNLGVRAARGEWIAFLDADDFWLPDRLAWQAAEVERSPELELVYGCVQQFYSPELAWPDTTPHEEAAAVQAGIFPGTCLVRKATFERVGDFDTTLRVGEFIDWHARAQALGVRMRTIDEVLMRRRIHSSNTGVRERQAQSDYVKVLKAALDRRRAARNA